jgi:putative transposase
MPRRARVSVQDAAHHIIQRGNNRSACFYSEQDYECYLEWLFEYSEMHGCDVHAYVLMTNHVHLLITPTDSIGPAKLMKALGQRYVQYINRSYKRTGTLWEGRFRSCVTDDERYVLGCYRYIELNPVRANLVAHPAEYRWSSYRHNAQGKDDERLTEHALYQALSNDAFGRRACYRELFRDKLDPGLVDEIRQSTNGNYALGSDRFKTQIEGMLGRRVRPGSAGRPKLGN